MPSPSTSARTMRLPSASGALARPGSASSCRSGGVDASTACTAGPAGSCTHEPTRDWRSRKTSRSTCPVALGTSVSERGIRPGTSQRLPSAGKPPKPSLATSTMASVGADATVRASATSCAPGSIMLVGWKLPTTTPSMRNATCPPASAEDRRGSPLGEVTTKRVDSRFSRTPSTSASCTTKTAFFSGAVGVAGNARSNATARICRGDSAPPSIASTTGSNAYGPRRSRPTDTSNGSSRIATSSSFGGESSKSAASVRPIGSVGSSSTSTAGGGANSRGPACRSRTTHGGEGPPAKLESRPEKTTASDCDDPSPHACRPTIGDAGSRA